MGFKEGLCSYVRGYLTLLDIKYYLVKAQGVNCVIYGSIYVQHVRYETRDNDLASGFAQMYRTANNRLSERAIAELGILKI